MPDCEPGAPHDLPALVSYLQNRDDNCVVRAAGKIQWTNTSDVLSAHPAHGNAGCHYYLMIGSLSLIDLNHTSTFLVPERGSTNTYSVQYKRPLYTT